MVNDQRPRTARDSSNGDSAQGGRARHLDDGLLAFKRECAMLIASPSTMHSASDEDARAGSDTSHDRRRRTARWRRDTPRALRRPGRGSAWSPQRANTGDGAPDAAP